MYRTDKQFMKNPATTAARVYVGALSKTTVADDLENLFKKHGNITGMSVNTGFAFVQFETEAEAQSAIREENGTFLNGRKIIVKQALDKSKPGGPLQKGPHGGPSGSHGGHIGPHGGISGPQRGPPKMEHSPRQINQSQMPQKTPPPPLQNEPKEELSFQPPDRDADFQDDSFDDDRPNIRPPPGSGKFNDDRGRRGGRKRGGPGGGRGGGPRGKSNDRDRFDRDRERDSFRFEPPPPDVHREPFYGRDNYGPPQRVEPFAQPVVDAPPPAPDKNDCEIIVVAKALTYVYNFICILLYFLL